MREFITLFLLNCVWFHVDVTADGYFWISGSKIIRGNSPYELAVTTNGYDECCPKLQLTLKAGTDEQSKFEEKQIVELENGKTKTVKFEPKVPDEITTYLLEAKTLTGPYLQRSVLLHKAEKHYSVLIQTDKSMYKPSDAVKFRVLVLDQDTKPFTPSNIDIFINDADNNRLKQFLNVSLQNGVYKNEFQLFESAALGQWKIIAKVNAGKGEEKTFQVAKYVLPKFEVSIVSDSFLTKKDEVLKVTVNAKYTHGKRVKGIAIVTVSGYDANKSERKLNINGKGTVEFDLKKDLKLILDDYYDHDPLQIEVKFTEELTGNEQTAKTSTKIFNNRNTIKLNVGNKNQFKPGLPFRFYISGKSQDEKPISDEFNKVKVNVSFWNEPLSQYCNKSADTTTYNLTLKNGIAPLEVMTSKDVDYINIRAEYLMVVAEEEVKAINSNSGGFMQARVHSKTPRIRPSLNETFTVFVEATEELSELIYQISNRGNVVETKFLEFPKTKITQFEVQVNFAMIPQSNIVIFYFRPNGEIVSDEITVDFANDLPNFINFELSASEVKPDSKLDITFRTNPLSYVGLLGVDQSSLLLGSNDLKASQIFDRLKEYNSIDHFNNDDFSILNLSDDDYLNIDDENFMEKFEFENSNSFVITNKFFHPSNVTSLSAPNDERDVIVSERCRSRYLYKSKYACCPLTKEEKEMEEQFFSESIYSIFSDPLANRFSDDAPVWSFGGAPPAPLSPAVADFQSFEPLLSTTEGVHTDLEEDSQLAELSFNILGGEYTEKATSYETPKFEIRKSFPETWFFEDIQLDQNDNGTKTLTKTVPSEITSWVITGFSLNPSIGIGLTTQATKLKVFQPFFVSVNLPYSIKRGETVAIPATVFNYQNYELPVYISLHNENREFEFVDIDEDENDLNGKSSINLNRTKRAVIPADDGVSVSFMIRPLKVGYITIKLVATSPIAGDGLEKMLLVEPEGVTKYINKVVLLDLKESKEITKRSTIDIHPNVVPDSTKIEIGVVGDIMGPTIENLEKLIKLPYGCGEQNMLNFVPNIVVLNYMTTVNKLTPTIKQRLIKYLESGYQRELRFRHRDGSYSAFGRSDKNGSTWLTAFVAKSFGEASKFITVDDKIIKTALTFLKNVQQSDGQFPEVGNVIHKDMQGGSSLGIGLTSYTLLAFLENTKYRNDFKDTIDRALTYITDNLNVINDTYSMTIVAYTLQLADHSKKDELLDKLKSIAEQENGEIFWRKSNVTKPASHNKFGFYYEEPKTLDVEMTAYALNSFVLANRIPEATSIMRWMLKQRNENGGFQSTQDTVVGLQALASLAQQIYSDAAVFNISVKSDKDPVEKKLQVNAENALLLQREELNPATKVVEISANGEGFGLLQISYKFNVKETENQPKFILQPKVQDTSDSDSLSLKVCIKYIPSLNDISNESNMAIMEVELPSGYTLDAEHIPLLEQSNGVKKVETQKKETLVIIYFNNVNESGYCPQLKAFRTNKVANQKPVSVTVYDYYDNSNRVTEFYEPPAKTLCDICEGEDCKKSCENATSVTEKTPESSNE